MNNVIGTKGYFLDEVPDRHDNLMLPPKQLRQEQSQFQAETQRVVQVMGEDYATAEEHLTGEVEFAHRIVPEGKAALEEEVMTPLRRGQMSAKDAAKRVAEMRADLNRAREALLKAAEREKAKWNEVGVPHLRFYELRHAGISRHVDRIGQDGALTLKEIQERAGHSSATMTLDRYARSSKPDRSARRRALDAVVAIETTNVTPIAARRRAN